MLTLNTQIPTQARGQVRALVKAHAAWLPFIKARGKESAQALNSELLEFALLHPTLAAQIESLLMLTPNGVVQSDTPDTSTEENDMAHNEGGNVWLTGPAGTGMVTYDLDGVLSSVDQFLAPLVRGELSKALGPVITAANKPAVEIEKVVEIERIVEVAPGEKPRAAIQRARKDKKTTFRTLYPSRAKDVWRDVQLTLWAGVLAPAVDPYYVTDHFQMALFLSAIERGTNVWLAGPSGTGKSTLPEQAAAVTGRPFVKIGMTRQTDVETLIGGPGLHNGATIWEDGVLVKAMRAPGTIILIDELTMAPAGVQAVFQLVSDDHRSITLPTGEVVKCAEGVVFVVADNTTGSGDEGGLYAGTNISNAALVTRFKRMIIVDYLPAKKEAEALANHTACPMPAAQHLADFVAQARKLPALQGVVISLRQMVGFVQCVQDGFASKDAFTTTISSRMPATERAAIEALADLAWNNTFEAMVHSKPVPATPSDSPGARAFADEY